MPDRPMEQVMDDVIRETTWRNIRRYITIGGLLFVVLDLCITLSVVIVLAHATRASDLEHSQQACRNTATLALIQHNTVNKEQQNTQALIDQGFTFGLPKDQLNKLVADGKARTDKYLAALDALAKSNCQDLE